jgi:hypothetical protein
MRLGKELSVLGQCHQQAVALLPLVKQGRKDCEVGVDLMVQGCFHKLFFLVV